MADKEQYVSNDCGKQVSGWFRDFGETASTPAAVSDDGGVSVLIDRPVWQLTRRRRLSRSLKSHRPTSVGKGHSYEPPQLPALAAYCAMRVRSVRE